MKIRNNVGCSDRRHDLEPDRLRRRWRRPRRGRDFQVNVTAASAGIKESETGTAWRLTLLNGTVNADGTVTLPMPATVILDPGRTVRWIDVHPDYSTRTEPRQVIDALDHLGH
jgi:hypothetical protein